MTINLAARITAAAFNTRYLAEDTTIHDVSTNFFVEWKYEIAIASVVILGTVGLLTLGQRKFIGLGLICLGFFLAAVFLKSERWVKIFENSTGDLDRKPQVNDPFKNPKRLGLGPAATLVLGDDGPQLVQVQR